MNSTTRDHAHVQALMPWVLNGRADAEQQAQVQQHLADCPACQAEMARQQRLQTALQLPPAQAPDAEQGLDRLLQRIDLDAVDDQPRPRAAPSPRGQRLSLALAACVVLQAVALVALAPQAWRTDDAVYHTLSQATPATGGQLRVVPDRGLSLGAWQDLLLAEGLQVSSGPNQAGAYTLVSTSKPERLDALVLRLRARSELRLVEPLQETP